jgi:hypothetical protein
MLALRAACCVCVVFDLKLTLWFARVPGLYVAVNTIDLIGDSGKLAVCDVMCF